MDPNQYRQDSSSSKISFLTVDALRGGSVRAGVSSVNQTWPAMTGRSIPNDGPSNVPVARRGAYGHTEENVNYVLLFWVEINK